MVSVGLSLAKIKSAMTVPPDFSAVLQHILQSEGDE